MPNISALKALAQAKGIDLTDVEDASLPYESTWIRKMGGLSGESPSGGSLKNAIGNEVANMPDQESLAGLWFLDYDVVANEGDANNQRVFDWSDNENHGLRGNSTTPNTSSPEGSIFDGTADFVQVAYNVSMNTTTTGSVTLGAVAAQSAVSSSYVVSQNLFNRSIRYDLDEQVWGYFTGYRRAAANRALNTLEHYMVAGDGSNINMYKNGVLSNDINSSVYNAYPNNQPFYIGRRSSGDYFSGTIKCVYLYTSNQSSNAALINTIINNILIELGGP